MANKGKNKLKRNTKEKYGAFAVISGSIAAFISIILMKIIDWAENPFGLGDFMAGVQIFSIALGIIGLIALTVTIILKNKAFIVYSAQVLFLAGSMWLYKYFALDDKIFRINGDGVADFFYIAVQCLIWLYVLGLVISCIWIAKKR